MLESICLAPKKQVSKPDSAGTVCVTEHPFWLARTYLAAVFLTTLVGSQLRFLFILLVLSVLNPDQTRSCCEKSPARVQRLIPAPDGKLLQANSGEVAEWLNAAVC
jgi:hypothetical protein